MNLVLLFYSKSFDVPHPEVDTKKDRKYGINDSIVEADEDDQIAVADLHSIANLLIPLGMFMNMAHIPPRLYNKMANTNDREAPFQNNRTQLSISG